jgi:amino acid transporter
MVIGVASTAPAYSLAATLGFIVAAGGVGVHAPAVLIVSVIPMVLISFGYRYLNRADPDAGTTFAWVTRALGPQLGWLNGWAIFVADVIVMASLSVIASTYTYLLFGRNSAASSTTAIIIDAADSPCSADAPGYAANPSSIQVRNRSTSPAGQAPSHGMVPSASRV